MIFKLEDQKKYMNDPEFIPLVMGLNNVAPGIIRIVVMPSFDPEEVWDINDDGEIDITCSEESIWHSIPQRLKMAGSKEWTCHADGKFTTQGCRKIRHKLRIGIFSDIDAGLKLYKNNESMCCDGMGFIFSMMKLDKVVHCSIHELQPSALRAAIKEVFVSLQSLGHISNVYKYLH